MVNWRWTEPSVELWSISVAHFEVSELQQRGSPTEIKPFLFATKLQPPGSLHTTGDSSDNARPSCSVASRVLAQRLQPTRMLARVPAPARAQLPSRDNTLGKASPFPWSFTRQDTVPSSRCSHTPGKRWKPLLTCEPIQGTHETRSSTGLCQGRK